jgi:hypothetical protein
MICLQINFARAQSLPTNNLIVPEHGHCGIDQHFAVVKARADSANNKLALTAYTNPNAKLDCGKFRLCFEDIQLATGSGFDDASSGLVRRNTVCQVLTYIQTVFDFSAVPSTDPIMIEVEQSILNIGVLWLANAGAYPNLNEISGTPGYYGGLVYDKITNYTGYPALKGTTQEFDGRMEFNWGYPYHNDGSTPNQNCPREFDLYSVVLHEVFHAMGWYSNLRMDVDNFPINKDLHNTWSLLDRDFLYHGDITTSNFQKFIIGGSAPTINPLLANNATAMIDNSTWMRDVGENQDNAPVYAGTVAAGLGVGSLMHHLDEQYCSEYFSLNFSPRKNPYYVMGPSISHTLNKRIITDAEARIMHTFGYAYNTLHPRAPIWASNHKPEVTRPYSQPLTAITLPIPAVVVDDLWADNLPADFTIINNNTAAGTPSVLNINVGSLPYVADTDPGDVIAIIPNSIVGLRGTAIKDPLGISNNNHNCVTLNGTGTILSYTPRPDFVGRAQFMCQLTDGKEDGAIVVFTIDVLAGNNVAVLPIFASEMVVNGDLEMGTEINDLNTTNNQVKAGNNMTNAAYKLGNFMRGACLADGMPAPGNAAFGGHVPLPNFIVQASHVISRESTLDCSIGEWVFGSYFSSFPGTVVQHPLSFGAGLLNDRYSAQSYTPVSRANFTLNRPVVGPTNFYRIELDIRSEVAAIPAIFSLGLSNALVLTATTPTLQVVDIHLTTAQQVLGQWHHLVVEFQYCNATAASTLAVLGQGLDIYFDNLSLKQITMPALIVGSTFTASTCATDFSVEVMSYYNSFTVAGPTATFTTTINPVPISNVSGTAVYTITASNNGICSNSATISLTAVTASPICACTTSNLSLSDFEIVPNTITSSSLLALFSATTNVLSGKNIILQGSLILDGDLTLDACTVRMASPTGEIITDQYNLTIQNLTTVAGCATMWQGIRCALVSPTNIALPTYTVSVLQSTISDMQFGIQLDNRLLINSKGCLYLNNWVSLDFARIASNNALLNTVWNNTFWGLPGGVKVPYLHQMPRNGVKVTNCKNILIGGPTSAEANAFTHLQNGIEANYTAAYGNKTSTGAFFKSNYNTFANILYGYDTWENSIDGDPLYMNNSAGTAVYVDNQLPKGYVSATIQGKAAGLVINKDFNHCKRGLLSKNCNTYFLENRVFDVQAGAIAHVLNKRATRYQNNDIEDAMIGLSKYGMHGWASLSAFGFVVAGNTIKLAPFPSVSGVPIGVSKGIDAFYFSATPSPGGFILRNAIEVPMDTKAFAISIDNSSWHQITGNKVRFSAAKSASSTSDPVGTMPSLIGIKANNSRSLQINENYVTGSGSANQSDKMDAASLYLVRSSGATINCNAFDHTRFGIFTVGPNQIANYDAMNGNRYHNKWASMYNTPLAGNGEIGSVGINTAAVKHDGDNIFSLASGKPSVLTGIPMGNVHRASAICAIAGVSDQISTKTSRLVPAKSTSDAFGCFTIVNNFLSTENPVTFTCSTSLPGILPPFAKAPAMTDAEIAAMIAASPDLLNVEQATVIANNAQSYYEFVNGAQGLDQRLLQDWLRNNPAVRTQNPILNTFYLEQQQDDMDNLGKIDELLVALTDSIIVQDSLAFDSLYNYVSLLNEDISSPEYFVSQEKFMNRLYLKLVDGKTIDDEEFSQVNYLANECPYIAGNATYKARDIMQLYGIAKTYDDRALCNSQGVYRHAGRPNAGSAPLITMNVYPNPTSGVITIDISDVKIESIVVEVYDVTAQLVLQQKVKLLDGIGSIDFSNLSASVYNLKILQTNGQQIGTHRLVKW